MSRRVKEFIMRLVGVVCEIIVILVPKSDPFLKKFLNTGFVLRGPLNLLLCHTMSMNVMRSLVFKIAFLSPAVSIGKTVSWTYNMLHSCTDMPHLLSFKR